MTANRMIKDVVYAAAVEAYHARHAGYPDKRQLIQIADAGVFQDKDNCYFNMDLMKKFGSRLISYSVSATC